MSCLQSDKLYKTLSAAISHPELLLGCKSLQALENYINGYLDACAEISPDCFTIQWYGAFRCYISEVLGIQQEKFSIFEAISGNGYNDTNGIDRFAELLKCFSPTEYKKDNPSALEDGEVRIFCVDATKATEFISVHVRERVEDYFCLPPDETYNLIYNWSRKNNLTCAICNGKTNVAAISPNNPKFLEELEKLPIFTAGDRIRYNTLCL